MSFTKHILMWIIAIVFMSLISSPIFNNYAHKHSQDEKKMVYEYFGDTAGDTIKNRSKDTFDTCCSSAVEFTREYFVTDSDGNSPSEFLSGIFNNTWGSVYQAIVRFHIFIEFSAYLIPFVFAALFDAFQIRKIKAGNREWFSPLRYHGGLHAILGMFGLIIVYLLTPFTVHIFFLIGWFVLLAMLFSMTFRNMQPKV